MFDVRIRDEMDAAGHRLCQWPATKPLDELVNLVRSHDLYVGDTTADGRQAQISTQIVVNEDEDWAYVEIIVHRDDDGNIIGSY